MDYDLSRFRNAQEHSYAAALSEIQSGRKKSHWMWFIFPQLRGLGHSYMAFHYGIVDLDEAEAYLADPVLGGRLLEISRALLSLPEHNATAVMGSPDDLKLRSSMTLFACVPDAPPVFSDVLQAYFGGNSDERTLEMLGMRPGMASV